MPLLYRTSPFQLLVFAIISLTLVISFLSSLRAQLYEDDALSNAKPAMTHETPPKSNEEIVKQSSSRFAMTTIPEEVSSSANSFETFRDPFDSTRTVFYGLLY